MDHSPLSLRPKTSTLEIVPAACPAGRREDNLQVFTQGIDLWLLGADSKIKGHHALKKKSDHHPIWVCNILVSLKKERSLSNSKHPFSEIPKSQALQNDKKGGFRRVSACFLVQKTAGNLRFSAQVVDAHVDLECSPRLASATSLGKYPIIRAFPWHFETNQPDLGGHPTQLHQFLRCKKSSILALLVREKLISYNISYNPFYLWSTLILDASSLLTIHSSEALFVPRSRVDGTWASPLRHP